LVSQDVDLESDLDLDDRDPARVLYPRFHGKRDAEPLGKSSGTPGEGEPLG